MGGETWLELNVEEHCGMEADDTVLGASVGAGVGAAFGGSLGLTGARAALAAGSCAFLGSEVGGMGGASSDAESARP